MSKIEKLLLKFKTVPENLTGDELIKILNHFGYFEKVKKGKMEAQEESLSMKKEIL